MDLDTEHLMARLNAQNEYMDMNEEDCDIDDIDEYEEEETEIHGTDQSDTQATTQATQNAPRKRKLTSKVWEDFVSVGLCDDGKERGKCIHCGSKLVINTKTHGTRSLHRHLEKCPKKPKKEDRPPYDHQINREMTSEIIIYHDLPFRYPEYEKVRARDKYLNPECQPICRQTAAADVYRKYEMEKDKLKEVLANHRGRVCFTSDLWTARGTVMSYICLTAHYIDENWHLNNKILAFCEFKSPHTGEEISNKILECLKEWGLERKVFSITLDNATNNNSMLNILKGQLQMISGSGLLCDGKFMHVRCCAHILNLIVKKGLDLAKGVLHNIRESVIYVKASPKRKDAFAACVERVKIESGAGLSLDVPTRWNSTYEMLVRALKFKEAFVSLQWFDRNYKTLPSDDEWNRGEKICELLKPFSDITTHFSGSKYPTSSVYFTQVWRIELLLRKFASCDDEDVAKLAQEMQVMFTKYWEDYSLILAMGAVLDPRMKLQMIEAAYEKVDPTTFASKMKELKDNLEMLYEDYKAKSRTCSSSVNVTPNPHDWFNESPLDDDNDNDLYELENSIGVGVGKRKTHLDIYLEEPRLERKCFSKLDVLSFWKDNQQRLGELASLACEILSIPITTVASESAFSIGSRVITPYRNRLLPKNVQALLCTRNWLRGFADYEGNIETNDDIGTTEDARKIASTSGAECSRSGDSSMH